MFFSIKILIVSSVILTTQLTWAINPDHLAKLKKTNTCLLCDLSNSDFRNQNLENAVLRGSNLSGSSLNGANLTNADLNGVNFIGADLSNAILLNSDINWIKKDSTTKMCKATMPDGMINTDC
tara:strand:- start:327 stop:695 length:369 start_codon:yes stop_codon:yes gene_type:complete